MALDKLCKGYMVRSEAKTKKGIETLYALQDGNVYSFDAPLFSTEFNSPERRWKKVDKLPNHCEFIGNYSRLSLLQRMGK